MTRCIRTSGIYRSRNGVFLGVCRGIAEFYDLSVFWVRMIMVVIFLCTGFWPVLGIYIVMALLLKPEPIRPIQSEEEQEFYDSYVRSPESAAQRLKKKFENLERRIRRMEDRVTGKDFEWERKMRNGV